MNSTSSALSLIGRLLLATIFIVSGVDKISGFEGLVGAIGSKGLPVPQAFAVATIIVEIGAGLMLAVGWKARWAAFVLAAFTAVVSVLFHGFWDVPAAQKVMQQIHFMKNAAIIGGLLFVMAFGPGRFSIDKR